MATITLSESNKKVISSPPLNEKQIQRFKEIILKHKGIYLTDDEAEAQATRWLKLSKIVMLIDPVENESEEKQ